MGRFVCGWLCPFGLIQELLHKIPLPKKIHTFRGDRFLRGLGAESRNIFVRRYFYLDSVKEVAGRFGVSESKVKSLLFRLRNRLREHLEKEGIEL